MNLKKTAHAWRKRVEGLGASPAGVGAAEHDQPAGDQRGTAKCADGAAPGGTDLWLGPRGPAVVVGAGPAGRDLRRAQPSQQRFCFLESAGSFEVDPTALGAVETAQVSFHRGSARDSAYDDGAGSASLTRLIPPSALHFPAFGGSGSQPNCCHWPSRSMLTVISWIFPSASRNRLMPITDTA